MINFPVGTPVMGRDLIGREDEEGKKYILKDPFFQDYIKMRLEGKVF